MADASIFAGNFATSPEILCPTTGSICPARLTLVENYTEYVTPQVDAQVPPECRSHLDGAKLKVRLAEYGLKALGIGCEGPQDNICPTRTAMDQSPSRQRAVSILRTSLTKIGIIHG